MVPRTPLTLPSQRERVMSIGSNNSLPPWERDGVRAPRRSLLLTAVNPSGSLQKSESRLNR